MSRTLRAGDTRLFPANGHTVGVVRRGGADAAADRDTLAWPGGPRPAGRHRAGMRSTVQTKAVKAISTSAGGDTVPISTLEPRGPSRTIPRGSADVFPAAGVPPVRTDSAA